MSLYVSFAARALMAMAMMARGWRIASLMMAGAAPPLALRAALMPLASPARYSSLSARISRRSVPIVAHAGAYLALWEGGWPTEITR